MSVSERSGWTNGVYLSRERWEALEQLAAERGVKVSTMIGSLVDAAAARRSSVPEVLVDGRRFVPARRRS